MSTSTGVVMIQPFLPLLLAPLRRARRRIRAASGKSPRRLRVGNDLGRHTTSNRRRESARNLRALLEALDGRDEFVVVFAGMPAANSPLPTVGEVVGAGITLHRALIQSWIRNGWVTREGRRKGKNGVTYWVREEGFAVADEGGE